MNLAKLKSFAPAARTAFIAAVTRRAGILGILPNRVESVTESGDVALIGGQPFPRSVVPLRKKLLDIIQRDGFGPTMEAMAYTWFNRLVALRFMELHDGYLDHGYRVLSHPQGNPLPEILQHAEHVDLKGLDREEVIRFKLDGNRDEELYRLLLLAQCAELNHILPDVFSRIDDATILLLPDNLLHSDSLIRQLVANSDAEDWQQVEILGWLYQFYISERKDQVMARKSAVPTEDIPAVTQLFTPHWIVRYLVENSLGRLWLLNRPGSRLREHMPYYIEGEKNAPGGSPDDFLKITKPEEIRLCDPAVGSGHMLTYAFDLLTLIYEEEGYAPTEIPALILRHNLHGLEICPRAAQLAELALVFKAREKSRRFFQPEHLVRPHIIELRDVRFDEGELAAYFKALGIDPSGFSSQPSGFVTLLHQFEEAKNFGSLIQPCLDERAIANARRAIEAKDLGGQLFLRETHLKVLRVLEQAEALTQRYHVVVANPPYMKSKFFNGALKRMTEKTYSEGHPDLYGCFIQQTIRLALPRGEIGMITIPNWLFLSSFADLRASLISGIHVHSLIHNGRGIWGADFGSCAFTITNSLPNGRVSHFRRLFEKTSEVQSNTQLEKNYFDTSGYPVHNCDCSGFKTLPFHIFAYWISPELAAVFGSSQIIEDVGVVRQGFQTGDNDRFMRFWHEVGHAKSKYDATAKDDIKGQLKWVPYNKGGEFQKWYGNNDYVVAFDEENYNVLLTSGNCLPSRNLYFREGVTWSALSISLFSARHSPAGYTFSAKGAGCFPPKSEIFFILALLNTVVARKLFEFMAATVDFNVGSIRQVPLPRDHAAFHAVVTDQTRSCVSLARADWDNFETSWDFRDQPLLRPGLKGATLEASWRNWEAQSTAAIRRMQELETENNRLFIAAYGLDGELQPEVPEAQITLARAEARRDMAAFLSYATGCMMGRYSLDADGLILADAGGTVEDFRSKIVDRGLRMDDVSFAPDADGIIPVLDGEWFEDDIVARTRDFLRATFGEATLTPNLEFIQQSLGRELRDYFLTDFYKDHLQTYKNRPIYWLLSSGKQKAFQCLVYLHRYTPATLARIRTEYAIPLQGKLGARITRLEEETGKATASTTRKKLQTEVDKAKKQMVELLAFDEQLRSYADQSITLDLDDGVKTNYAKFGPLLAEAKKVCGTKDD